LIVMEERDAAVGPLFHRKRRLAVLGYKTSSGGLPEKSKT
jgi:hypothetical protein